MKRLYTTEQLQGRKFHHLTLKEHYIKVASDDKRRHFWLCTCDCGKEVERREDYIVKGKTHSCGCQHPRHMRRSARKQWRGAGELSGAHFSEIRCRAKRHGIPFEITIQQAWDLFMQQDRRCALTDIPLVFPSVESREQTASLDRKDSDGGYTLGNVWWVHKDVNMMKKEYPLDRFIEVCKAVVAKAA